MDSKKKPSDYALEILAFEDELAETLFESSGEVLAFPAYLWEEVASA